MSRPFEGAIKAVAPPPSLRSHVYCTSPGPRETLHFTAPNQTKTVKTSWTLSKGYRWWEQIRVTSPNFIRSNKAGFTLRCR
jgi:hypothetical protein